MSGEDLDDCHVHHTWKGISRKPKEWMISFGNNGFTGKTDLQLITNNKNLMEASFKV